MRRWDNRHSEDPIPNALLQADALGSTLDSTNLAPATDPID